MKVDDNYPTSKRSPVQKLLLKWRPFRWRIAPTLALIFTGTVTVAMLINGLLVVNNSLRVAQQATEQRLRDATKSLAAKLNGDEIATIRKRSQQSNPIYLRSHARLHEGLDQIQGARFIYTLRKVTGKPKDAFSQYAFVIDGTSYSSKDFAPIGQVMTTTPSTDALHRVWKTGRFEVDKNFVTDQWGTWLSGYYPIFLRDGSFTDVIGVDISADNVVKERELIISTLSQGYLLSMLILLPSAAVFGRRISSPLRRINERLLAISRLEFNPVQSSRPLDCQWVHEIHEVSNSLVRVESALVDFSRYVPAKLVRQLMVNNSKVPLDGVESDLAIMFTDVIGFTALTEKLSPDAILRALNEYFTIIHESAEQTHGILDKYMGDSALLYWGAPDAIKYPALAAVEAALLCYQRIEELSDRWNLEGTPMRFSTCFGLDYGAVVVGNIGSSSRVNYTIVGDRVNLCSRVESVNRRYGTHILASGSLIHALGSDVERFLIVKIDDARLRGISEPVELFEIRGRRSEATQEDLNFVHTYEAAFQQAEVGSLASALALIESLPQRFQDVGFVQVALHRWRQARADPGDLESQADSPPWHVSDR